MISATVDPVTWPSEAEAASIIGQRGCQTHTGSVTMARASPHTEAHILTDR